MLNRRDAMIRLGQVGLGSATLPLLSDRSRGAGARPASARSCIFIFLWGGPPQQDMWDLKPEAPQGIRSLFAPIATNVSGITFSDQLPLLARQADKLAVVRSFSHESNNHEPSVYHVLTGKKNPALVVPANFRRRSDFPNVGSVVSYFTPPSVLPASVTVPRPVGHDGVTYAGTHAGFLGPRHDPLELKEAPNAGVQPSHSLDLPEGLASARLIARQGLLKLIEAEERRLEVVRAGAGLDASREQALRLLASPQAKRAFDLDREDPRTRDRYGRNEYGESFLMARRLVEAGVRLVSVNWMYFMPNGRIANVWDNHGGTAGLGGITGYAMLKEKYCLPPLDQGLSALLEDLDQRGLLDETLVVAVGEFGRTPKINPAQGRDHWGACGSAVLAGGGVRGGQLYGASDRIGAFPSENPVSPEDLLATIHHALGIDPASEIRDREGRPFRISEGRPVTALFV